MTDINATDIMIAPQNEASAALPIDNMLLNAKAMNTLFKMAKVYAGTALVPDTYRNSPENCFLACELAARMNISPVLVMQNLYIVKGRPSWAGSFCIAMINGCGMFDHPLEFVFVGERGKMDWGCYAVTHKDGKEIRGTLITLQMAKDEGWLNKSGSKWLTMPDQMAMYRAAAFFARVHCPNVLMGYSTADESMDIGKEEKPKTVIKLTKECEPNE